jgi:signal transduction histidine kinase
LLEEVQRLKVMVRKLLLLAQADAGQMKLSRERMDLSGEVLLLGEDAQQAAAGLQVECQVEPGLLVLADPDLLRQALQNLTSNAIKHNRPGGRVAIRLDRDGTNAVVTVSKKIPEDARIVPDRLFDRFYRADAARGRGVDGAGLGLSLAREIVRAHQGDLALHELKADRITFALTLPAA